MEAMRLSLLDHEDHQRRQTDSPERAPDKRKFSLTVPNTSSRRASESSKHERGGSTASKLFSKITNSGNRSRSASTASSLKAVSFSSSTTNLAGPSRSPAPSATLATPSPPLPPSSLAPAPQPVDLPTPIGEPTARLSLEEPLAAKSSSTHAERAPLHRQDTDVSEAPTERPSYARLDSGDL